MMLARGLLSVLWHVETRGDTDCRSEGETTTLEHTWRPAFLVMFVKKEGLIAFVGLGDANEKQGVIAVEYLGEIVFGQIDDYSNNP
ncbi:hypothetical protein TNIN_270821 [Trichonephila inaurata madagascariensis]|uniref:Uncharacterized protein n=1 Tax=Trichonephila inaurata madagascariensis TaxID=2747483 RepID=A0A8X7CCM6_9ARAC|nr:hypothetical protein TNIN_270821 [Trichonephila inaurata madagascariensis]